MLLLLLLLLMMMMMMMMMIVAAVVVRVVSRGLRPLRPLQGADLILVMNNGTLVESGTHATLLCRNGTYQKLWARQQSRGVTLVQARDSSLLQDIDYPQPDPKLDPDSNLNPRYCKISTSPNPYHSVFVTRSGDARLLRLDRLIRLITIDARRYRRQRRPPLDRRQLALVASGGWLERRLAAGSEQSEDVR